MGRALLVADQDVLQPLLVEQGVIDRQHRPARIAEKHLDALVDKGADDDLGSSQGVLGGVGFDGLVGGHFGGPWIGQ